MRILAISDLHVDYDENRRWLYELPRHEYSDDILILAGDISHETGLLAEALAELGQRFRAVVFTPGNHDLWVYQNHAADSLARFEQVRQITLDCGVQMEPLVLDEVAIIPLLGWYDFSFGEPSAEVRRAWMDFTACRWPDGMDPPAVTRCFTAMNEPHLQVNRPTVITFSHFLPRIDLMPLIIPPHRQGLYPVLGSRLLEEQLRRAGASVHVYGHSHINMRNFKEGVLYLNNALGYPHETRTARQLVCVWEK